MVGLVEPRIVSIPAFSTSLGADAIGLAARCGLRLDPWQAHVVENGLGLTVEGKFAAFEVGVNVPRQNGKGVILETRELAGIFLIGEKLITHSSHQQDTSLEAMRRLLEALEAGGLDSELKSVRSTNGQEALIFKSGQRIRFRTRSKGAGRGFSGECLILDEAMFLPEAAIRALIPIMSAQANPQLWYAGSAVDQYVMENGVVWAGVRERGMAGDDPSLAYFEWSADLDDPDLFPERLDDVLIGELIRPSNPALGVRISEDYVKAEFRAMDRRGYAVERAGVGDYPRTDGVEQSVLKIEDWTALADEESEIVSGLCLAFDVGPERSASVAAAGLRADGLWHVEVVEHRRGTSWLPARLVELVAKHEPAVVVCDGYGPVASVQPFVEEAGVDVENTTAAGHGAACGRLVDAVTDGSVRHLGQEVLLAAVRGAKPRPLGDAWAWSRKNSSVDISPLVAATLALSAAMDEPDAGEVRIW